jgi:hypothetical protein
MCGMTMHPVPDVDDLTTLFGAERVSIFEDDWRTYWPYSTIRFSTIVDEYEIELEIEPGADTARCEWGATAVRSSTSISATLRQ